MPDNQNDINAICRCISANFSNKKTLIQNGERRDKSRKGNYDWNDKSAKTVK